VVDGSDSGAGGCQSSAANSVSDTADCEPDARHSQSDAEDRNTNSADCDTGAADGNARSAVAGCDAAECNDSVARSAAAEQHDAVADTGEQHTFVDDTVSDDADEPDSVGDSASNAAGRNAVSGTNPFNSWRDEHESVSAAAPGSSASLAEFEFIARNERSQHGRKKYGSIWNLFADVESGVSAG
jgi:hypothetical protein